MGGQHVQCEWDGFLAIHRYEDLALIRSVIEARRPPVAVELGTAEGGFAAFLATVLAQWDGLVLSVDRQQEMDIIARLRARYDNLTLLLDDVLVDISDPVASALGVPGALLYTDNGNKQLELETYVPLVGPGGTVGTHDYGTEVSADWAEAFMASYGYQPYRHAEFEALVDPVNYPVSYTRFWARP